jgi:hypothetical protein
LHLIFGVRLSKSSKTVSKLAKSCVAGIFGTTILRIFAIFAGYFLIWIKNDDETENLFAPDNHPNMVKYLHDVSEHRNEHI